MRIGITGYGKMGRDIFSLLFDKLHDSYFTVIDINGAEENTAAVLKNLGKSLKRKIHLYSLMIYLLLKAAILSSKPFLKIWMSKKISFQKQPQQFPMTACSLQIHLHWIYLPYSVTYHIKNAALVCISSIL